MSHAVHAFAAVALAAACSSAAGKTAAAPAPVAESIKADHSPEADGGSDERGDSHIERCSWSGTLRGGAALYAGETGGRPLGFVEEATVTIAPPVSGRSRAPIRISYPIAFGGFIEQPFVRLTHRVDVVPGALWLPQSMPLAVGTSAQGHVRIDQHFAKDGQPPPSPARLVKDQDCQALELIGAEVKIEQPAGDERVLEPGRIDIYASQNAEKRIGFIHGRDDLVILREQIGERARIFLLRPFFGDVWVDASKLRAPAPEQLFGMIGLLGAVPPTHLATAPIPLRAVARADAPTVAHVARHVSFKLGKEEDGFVAVDLPGVVNYRSLGWQGSVYAPLFARASDVERLTRGLSQ